MSNEHTVLILISITILANIIRLIVEVHRSRKTDIQILEIMARINENMERRK